VRRIQRSRESIQGSGRVGKERGKKATGEEKEERRVAEVLREKEEKERRQKEKGERRKPSLWRRVIGMELRRFPSVWRSYMAYFILIPVELTLRTV